MAKREKIMLLLMAVALVFGSYFLFFAPDQSEKTHLRGDDSEELNRFVMQAAKRLYKKNEATTAQYIIAQARTNWVRDPFISPKTVAPVLLVAIETPKKDVPVILFSYSGYLDVGGMRLAIINGQEYAIQDTVSPQGHILTHISPHQVILKGNGETPRLVIPLEESRVLAAEPPAP